MGLVVCKTDSKRRTHSTALNEEKSDSELLTPVEEQQKRKGQKMKHKLEDALLVLYPHMKPLLARRYATKYADAVLGELATRLAMRSDEEEADGELNFAAETVRGAAGRCDVEGKTGYIYTLMQEHPTTSIVICTYTGNSITQRVSRVIINPTYKAEVIQELRRMAIDNVPLQQTEQQQLEAIQAKANRQVRIDAESLASYIEHTSKTLRSDELETTYEQKLICNLRTANYLMNIAYEQNGMCYVDEYWDKIDSGRTHGHGRSLQRIAKEVRHAALGHCWRYDLKAASYALMTQMAKGIDPTIKTAGLQEYVQQRSVIRKRIALDVGISEEWMKQIFTALGFGAELKDNPYNSIRHKLGQEKFHKLIANAEFAIISNQLKSVSQTITDEIGSDDFDLFGATYRNIDPKDGSKRTKNQMLAWIYQRLETQVMQEFIEMLPCDYTVLLTVHDCVYLDKKLHSSTTQDIKYKLRSKYELVDFEGEKITPIHTPGYVSTKQREHDHAIQQHKAFIAQQVQATKSYIPFYCSSSEKQQHCAATH